MRFHLNRLLVWTAENLGPLAWIVAGAIVALLVGLGQLHQGDAAQGADSLLVASVLLALVFCTGFHAKSQSR